MSGEETSDWKFHHIGVIVDDMDKATEYYESLGFVDLPPATTGTGGQPIWKEMVAYGETIIKDGELVAATEPGSRPGRVKFCHIGSMQLELIQPRKGLPNINGDFLKNYGEGMNHIAYTVDAEHFDEEVEKMKARGLPIVFSGEETSGSGFAYFDARKVGGVIVELMRSVR